MYVFNTVLKAWFTGSNSHQPMRALRFSSAAEISIYCNNTESGRSKSPKFTTAVSILYGPFLTENARPFLFQNARWVFTAQHKNMTIWWTSNGCYHVFEHVFWLGVETPRCDSVSSLSTDVLQLTFKWPCFKVIVRMEPKPLQPMLNIHSKLLNKTLIKIRKNLRKKPPSKIIRRALKMP